MDRESSTDSFTRAASEGTENSSERRLVDGRDEGWLRIICEKEDNCNEGGRSKDLREGSSTLRAGISSPERRHGLWKRH